MYFFYWSAIGVCTGGSTGCLCFHDDPCFSTGLVPRINETCPQHAPWFVTDACSKICKCFDDQLNNDNTLLEELARKVFLSFFVFFFFFLNTAKYGALSYWTKAGLNRGAQQGAGTRSLLNPNYCTVTLQWAMGSSPQQNHSCPLHTLNAALEAL